MLKNLLKWMPNNEQGVYEKKLTGVMKRLKVQNYKFNWDRTSCFVEFNYNENFYRLEHSIEKAKKNGLLLNNGLDCLMELTQSLEDLCGIIDRGMYDFETWISGMEQSPSETMMPGFQEEFEIRYKTLGRQNLAEYNTDELKELFPFGTEPTLKEFKQNQINQRSLGKKARFEEIVSKRI
ncbi:hypothetical protein CUC15_10275 [Oceanobacillus zhaokaii]|uniref:Uncharacterized protein n=1 Tax=Oceanobacillus zhaokaii TaxID=2052660 RepID=A0A345PH07_9BACI|nr:hypothetical protein [Oceanobacillus zhaokaii]AXI09287.1 hypothetical protein CUC15_10275 [Oceanobacillus zhaokaii]